jgi:hypothetical protein
MAKSFLHFHLTSSRTVVAVTSVIFKSDGEIGRAACKFFICGEEKKNVKRYTFSLVKKLFFFFIVHGVL